MIYARYAPALRYVAVTTAMPCHICRHAGEALFMSLHIMPPFFFRAYVSMIFTLYDFIFVIPDARSGDDYILFIHYPTMI